MHAYRHMDKNSIGAFLDAERVSIFIRELQSVLISCARLLFSENFIGYALFAMKEQEVMPQARQLFYESGVVSLHGLIHAFLAEAEKQGVLSVDDVDGISWTLLSHLNGCSLLRALFTDAPIPDEEILLNVDAAMENFLSKMDDGPGGGSRPREWRNSAAAF